MAKKFERVSPEERKARAAEMMKQIEAGVARLASSDDWRAHLKTAAMFHRYSFQNQILIASQCPGASYVAGFQTWLKMNRCVRKGEKAIRIFAPSPYKRTEEDGSVTAGMFFRAVSVFDVSSTDVLPGKEDRFRPSSGLVSRVEGSEDLAAAAWDRLAAFARSQGWTVEAVEAVGALPGGANGCTDGTRIQVLASLPRAHAAKTLAHECAHNLLHFANRDLFAARETGRQEVEAESVACVVMDAFGIDTGAYSFGYVTAWSQGKAEAVREALVNVQRASKAILDGTLGKGAEGAEEEREAA